MQFWPFQMRLGFISRELHAPMDSLFSNGTPDQADDPDLKGFRGFFGLSGSTPLKP